MRKVENHFFAGPRNLLAGNHRFTSKFNGHLNDCIVLFLDEGFWAGDKRHESLLKAFITESTLLVEDKFEKVATVRNLLHLMMAGNDSWLVPASVDERRFCVFDVASTHRGDHAYFAAIMKQMEQEGG